jgi:hypothetical protein
MNTWILDTALARLLHRCVDRTDQLPDGRQTAPYSPELEPDIVLTRPHVSGVDETCTPFGDRRRWQHSVALDGSITLHLVAA